MITSLRHSCRRLRLILPSLASLLFSADVTAFHHPPPLPMMARRSARLLKRPLASNGGDQSVPPEQYSSMKVPELRDLLRQRGLAVSGVKRVLVERLVSTGDGDPPMGAPSGDATPTGNEQPNAKRAKKKSASRSSSATPSSSGVDCLPRTRERQLQSAREDEGTDLAIIGVDEAGRGPLAGPVVAAAAIVPTDIAGIIDSKKITSEDERERLYEELVASPDIRYAVAIVSAQRIDEINILQATLEGMRMATEAVIGVKSGNQDKKGKGENIASAERNDLAYVITGDSIPIASGTTKSEGSFYALIDGNKTPKEMPCPCESVIKGDGKEYAIGAASILAKVTRDRLMHEYDRKYPEYNLSQHKGYPTAAHMSVVKKIGASPIHRRTFAPLKHMEFDENGKIIG